MAKTKMNGAQLPWNEQVFIEAWQEWLQYRRERHIASYTGTGLKRTFSALVRDSGNDMAVAIKIIGRSIELSYQGLFPLPKSYGQQPVITADKLKDALSQRIAAGI